LEGETLTEKFPEQIPKLPIEKKPKRFMKKLWIPLVTIIAIVLVGYAFMVYDVNRNALNPGDDIKKQAQEEQIAPQGTPSQSFQPSGKPLLDEQLSIENRWETSLTIPEGRWIKVYYDFDNLVNFHMYREDGQSITEVQTGDKYFSQWDRNMWTKNGEQEYTFVIIPETQAIGRFIVYEMGHL